MVRILSDLHFGSRSSLVRDLRQLTPLLEGVERVVFNGDSVEMLFLEDRARGAASAGALKQLCIDAGAEPVFLTGNHDPTLTDLHRLELAGGEVLVTHGDILFHGLSPWGSEARLLREAHARERAALKQPAGLDAELQAMRRAALAVEGLKEKMRASGVKPGRLSVITRHLWPPWRPLNILTGWARTPFLANTLAARHAATARFVVIGHTHFSGVWRVGSRIIINTGGFLPLSRPLAVDLDDRTLTVRRVESGNGTFHLGEEMARFELIQSGMK